ncbi:hypothetical protein CHARACLAT_001642 [Characodon lateralis]|uniref:Uncharacterized protein n=1 Tax=Characodon lateralis TaxID=208331 RepID=A0ABU7DMJ1_9TELE|nr:hypothetical protein [Characodon lateralis]
MIALLAPEILRLGVSFTVNVSREVKSLCCLGNPLLFGGLLLSPISMRLQSKTVKLCNSSRRRNSQLRQLNDIGGCHACSQGSQDKERKHKAELVNLCQLSSRSKRLLNTDFIAVVSKL